MAAEWGSAELVPADPWIVSAAGQEEDGRVVSEDQVLSGMACLICGPKDANLALPGACNVANPNSAFCVHGAILHLDPGRCVSDGNNFIWLKPQDCNSLS